MKLVYSSQDSAQVGLMSSVLDAANISFEIRISNLLGFCA